MRTRLLTQIYRPLLLVPFLSVLLVGLAATTATGSDTLCGTQPCEETICSSPDVLECSDWNDGDFDGWTYAIRDGVIRFNGRFEDGAGLNGTKGWVHPVTQGEHNTAYGGRVISGAGFGPLYARLYIKFSPGYRFLRWCGQQKMFYLRHDGGTFWRIMLGAAAAKRMGGIYGSDPDTVGVFAFDYIGHIERYPNQVGDNPVLLTGGRWYAVEIMAHWTSATVNVVKIWVDGQLQMTRENFDDGVWTTASGFNRVSDSSYYGGTGLACEPLQDQIVYKDNYVVSKSYIGPVDFTPDVTAPSIPTNLIATPFSSSQIDLSWTASTDDESGINHYNIYRDGILLNDQPTIPSFSDTGVREATPYIYEVSAVNGARIESNRSSSAPATTPADTTPPAITSVNATGDPTKVMVVFSEPVDAGTATDTANYMIDNGIAILSASLALDLTTVTLTVSALSDGIPYTLTVNNVQDRASIPNSILPNTQQTFTYQIFLLTDDFEDNDMRGWQIIDEGTIEAPSNWNVVNGVVQQSSNIYGPSADATTNRKGTFAYWDDPSALLWTDYMLTATLRSSDNDGIGLLFRYQDPSNYYKIDLDTQRNFQTLVKVAGGIETPLATIAASYPQNAEMELQVKVISDQITVTFNGSDIFVGPITDSALPRGTVALYAWANTGAFFDHVVVQSVASTTDTTRPTIPQNLTATASSASQIELAWSAATDNVGVAGYDLYRDGGSTPMARTSATTYSDTGRAAGTTYTYQAAAYDAAGNTSALSAMVAAATQGNSGSGPSSGISSGGGGCGSIRLDPPNPPPPGQVALELAALLFPLLLLAWRRLGRARLPVSA